MNGYQERVHKEKEELEAKIEKLDNFVNGTDLWLIMDVIDQQLLREQSEVMRKYHAILAARIERFK